MGATVSGRPKTGGESEAEKLERLITEGRGYLKDLEREKRAFTELIAKEMEKLATEKIDLERLIKAQRDELIQMSAEKIREMLRPVVDATAEATKDGMDRFFAELERKANDHIDSLIDEYSGRMRGLTGALEPRPLRGRRGFKPG